MNPLKYAVVLVAALSFTGCAIRQGPDGAHSPEKSREEPPLFQATLLDDGSIFVPTSLEEAYLELDSRLSDRAKGVLVKADEELSDEDERIRWSLSHMGLGKWMRNNWQLWAGGGYGLPVQPDRDIPCG